MYPKCSIFLQDKEDGKEKQTVTIDGKVFSLKEADSSSPPPAPQARPSKSPTPDVKLRLRTTSKSETKTNSSPNSPSADVIDSPRLCLQSTSDEKSTADVKPTATESTEPDYKVLTILGVMLGFARIEI